MTVVVLLCWSGAVSSRLQRSSGGYDLPMRSLARPCLHQSDLVIRWVDGSSCICPLLSSSGLRSVPGELYRLCRSSWLTGPSPSDNRRRRIRLRALPNCLRNVVVARPHLVRGPCLGHLVLPGRALAAPFFVLTAAGGTFPGDILSGARRAVSGVVFLRTLATCCCCLALGSYVAISLALEALLHSALPLVSLALKDFALPDQAFIDDPVGVLCLVNSMVMVDAVLADASLVSQLMCLM
jgi:hypothetical protein